MKRTAATLLALLCLSSFFGCVGPSSDKGAGGEGDKGSSGGRPPAEADYKEALEKLDKTAECNRSYMTTVSVEEIESLKAEIKEKMK